MKLVIAFARNVGSGPMVILKFEKEIPKKSEISKEEMTELVENVEAKDAETTLQKAVDSMKKYFGNDLPAPYPDGREFGKRVRYLFPYTAEHKLDGLAATLKVWMNEEVSGGIHHPGSTEMVPAVEGQVAVDAIAAIATEEQN